MTQTDTLERRPKYDDFKLTMQIRKEKSYETTDDSGNRHMYIQGLASGTNIDHHNERMAKTAIDAFKKAISDGYYLPSGDFSLIPLRSGHRSEWDDVLGYVTKAEIDEDYNLWIEAELDDTSSTARDLFAKLTAPPRPAGKPLQLGFSVGGKIKKASFAYDEVTKAKVRVIEDVILREISVVGSPANPTAYVEVLEKSINWDEISEQVQESNMTDTDVQKQAEATQGAAEDVNKSSEESSEQTNKVDSTGNATALENTTKSEDAAADPQADVTALAATVEALSKSVATLTDSVKTITDTLSKSTETEAKTENEEVLDKSAEVKEETVVEEVIEKSLEERIAESVASALASFKKDTLDPLTTELQAVKKNVDEIGSQELDKSFAVNNGKDGGEDDVLTKMRERIEKGQSILGAAVSEAYQPKQ